MNHLIAKMVWDGGDDVIVPEEMGSPHDKQMQGTTGEKLSEISSRICYESMGSGRDTAKTLGNILNIGHYSVFEHYMVPIRIRFRDLKGNLQKIMEALLNRPGVFARFSSSNEMRLTVNPRTVLDWDKITKTTRPDLLTDPTIIEIRDALQNVFNKLTPILVPDQARSWKVFKSIEAADVVEPELDQEKWISMYLSGSRGFTHELVRHGDWTGISQRSTRYLDEHKTPWVSHPLLRTYLDDIGVPEAHRASLTEEVEDCIRVAQKTYEGIIDRLEGWLLGRIDPEAPYRTHTARKQARGAARGFLGNALRTELIFSASVSQWRHMVYMRAADAADAEIREVFIKALEILKSSRYGDRFKDLELGPSSDRVGLSLVGGGHK